MTNDELELARVEPCYKPIPALSEPQAQARFWERVRIDMYDTDKCFDWTGKVNRYGYGVCRSAGGDFKAHRVAYTLARGPIADGLTLDHLCRNRLCCNPAHLEPVPQGVNTLRGDSVWSVNARKTHCKNGHAFTQENTRIVAKGRECRACVNARLRDAWQRGARKRGRNG